MEEDCHFFVGSYSNIDKLPHKPNTEDLGEGLYAFKWKDQQALPLSKVNVCNPAFLRCHPTLPVLYAITECIDEPGYVTAFKIHSDSLENIGSLTLTGKSTCYITFDKTGRYAILSNYWDGKVNVVELNEEGVPLRVVQELQQTNRGTWRQVENRDDHLANRQVGPHAHSVLFHGDSHVFITDLGDNCIYLYKFNNGNLSLCGHSPVPEGSGPRHLIIHPKYNLAFSGGELKNQLLVMKIDTDMLNNDKACLVPIQTLSTVPDDFKEHSSVAEIRVDNKGEYVYVSNRGHDSIAIFKVNGDSGVSLVQIHKITGKVPRHFQFSPCNKYLFVAAQDSGLIEIFNIHEKEGTLTPFKSLTVKAPNYILFYPSLKKTPTS